MTPKVDLVILSRHDGPIHPEVERGFRSQREVELVVHRVVGLTIPEDRCRWDAIARARNEGKVRGNSRWLMFLDDDVVLESPCVSTLVKELGRRPAFGALGADYLGEHHKGEVAEHVSMGATLFRREVLKQLRFASDRNKCECQCCCDDLRRRHWGIDYCNSARAHHLAQDMRARHSSPSKNADCLSNAAPATGQVLAAFDRRDLRRFCKQFLTSLRATGNKEVVIPVAVGLYPTERQRLALFPGLKPVYRSESGQHVARRRLREFAEITSALPSEMAIAYWDAGDVIFQSRLQPLWELIRMFPGKLLAAREPSGHPDNPAVVAWTESITDPAARRDAQQTIFHRPFLNSGFLAGEASALAKYFRTVSDWYDIPKLAGTLDWGDQLALNVYCHSHPEAWHEISDSWNYCLWQRNPKTCYRRGDGQYVDARDLPIHVVHGNARTLNSPSSAGSLF